MSDTAATSDSTPTPAAAQAPPGRFAHWEASLGLFVALFVLDHAVKWWAESVLMNPAGPPHRYIHVVPGFFALTYAENTGAAFSMFEGRTGALAIVSSIVSLGIAWFWWTLPARELVGRLALAAILSGAVGNLLDRVVRGYVVDMFLAYYKEWYWPVFNVADSMICVGAGVLIWLAVRGRI